MKFTVYVYQKSHFATWQKIKINIYVPHFKVFGKDSSLISIIAEIKIFVEFSILISSKSRTWIFTVGMFMNLSRLVLIIIKIKNQVQYKGREACIGPKSFNLYII